MRFRDRMLHFIAAPIAWGFNQTPIFIMKSKKKLRKGSIVTVTSSRHMDVLEGTKGRIVCEFEGGFGVKILAAWMVAGTDRGVRVTEARVVWYPKDELK